MLRRAATAARAHVYQTHRAIGHSGAFSIRHFSAITRRSLHRVSAEHWPVLRRTRQPQNRRKDQFRSLSSNTTTQSGEHEQLPMTELNELKSFLNDPSASHPEAARARELVDKMLSHHVYAEMDGQESTVMSMVGDGLEDPQLVVNVYLKLRDAGVSVSPLTIELTAKACAPLGDWQVAEEIVRVMNDAPDMMHPLQSVYENGVRACIEGTQWIRAKRLLEEMTMNKKFLPSPELHEDTIRLCMSAGETTATKQLLNQLVQWHEWDVEELEPILTDLFDHAIQTGAGESAELLASNIVEQGGEIDGDRRFELVCTFMAQMKWEETKEAFMRYFPDTVSPYTHNAKFPVRNLIMWTMNELDQQTGDIPRSVFNAALHGLGRYSHYSFAMDILDMMRNKYGLTPDAVSYTGAINACGWRVSASEELFNQMLVDEVIPTADIYSAYLLVPSRDHKWKRVLQRYDSLWKENLDTNVSNDSASLDLRPASEVLLNDDRIQGHRAVALGGIHDTDELLNVFRRMKMHGMEPNIYVHAHAMFAYIEQGTPEKALLLFDHLQPLFTDDELAGCSMVWDAVIKAAYQLRKIDKETSDRARILLSAVMTKQVAIADFSAVRLIQMLPEAEPAELWRSFRNMKQLHQQWNKDTPGVTPRVLNALLEKVVAVGGQEGSELAERMIREAQFEMNIQPNSMTYSLMLRLYASWSDDPDNFVLWANEMAASTSKSTRFTYRAMLRHLSILEGLDEMQVHKSLSAVRKLLTLKTTPVDGSDTYTLEDITPMSRKILEEMHNKRMGADALALEYYMRLSEEAAHSTLVIDMVENARGSDGRDKMHWSESFATGFAALAAELDDRDRGQKVLLRAISDMDRDNATIALAAFCANADSNQLVPLLEECLDEKSSHQLNDSEIVFFLSRCVHSSDAETDDVVIDDDDELKEDRENLATMCYALLDSDKELGNSTTAFLIEQIIDRWKEVELDGESALQEDVIAMQKLLANILRQYSATSVVDFFKQVTHPAEVHYLRGVFDEMKKDVGTRVE